jgi:murein DD-endopeptidase MepM/ murein hydrolase activator NlpD
MRGSDPQSRFQNIGKLTVPFGGKTAEEPVHPGVDFANTMGTPIHAPVSGTVTQAEGGHVQGENNFGNSVTLKDASGNSHEFHHLQNIAVKPGQQVQQGQPVGTMGNTGATYSPSGKGDGTHLDYRIVTAYGQYLNPTPFTPNL